MKATYKIDMGDKTYKLMHETALMMGHSQAETIKRAIVFYCTMAQKQKDGGKISVLDKNNNVEQEWVL
jgi:hypothetical protein